MSMDRYLKTISDEQKAFERHSDHLISVQQVGSAIDSLPSDGAVLCDLIGAASGAILATATSDFAALNRGPDNNLKPAARSAVVQIEHFPPGGDDA